MPSIKIQNMGGIAPRFSERLLPPSAAVVAQNCRLASGEIRPFKNPRPEAAQLKLGAIKTLYDLDGNWLSWEQDVDVVRGFVAGDKTGRIYYTGDAGPRRTNRTLATASQPYPVQGVPLGVNGPTVAPTVLLGVGGSGLPLLRYYVYTYVTDIDEESAPSLVSLGLNVLDGQEVTVSGFVGAAAPVNRIRLYRTVTGSNSTASLLVAEFPITQTSYNDTKLDVDLSPDAGLVSEDWLAPPVNMIGLTAHPNGFLVGFAGNELFVSEAYQPHAYPPSYVKVFDYPVVALGIFGNTIVVTTTGYIYLVTGVDPRNLTVERLPDPYPCVSKRSMVSADRGVIFASNDGLVWVGYGGVQVITRDVLTRQEWQQYVPSTMHACLYDGKYVGFYETEPGQDDLPIDPAGAGIVFDFNDRATGVEQRDKLSTLTLYATATYANPGRNFFFTTRVAGKNALFEWDSGEGYLPFNWVSKAFVMPFMTSFAAGKVVVGTVKGRAPDLSRTLEFSLFIGGELKYSRVIETSRPFRLPRGFRFTEPWYVQVQGTRDVQEIHLATSMEELSEGKAQ